MTRERVRTNCPPKVITGLPNELSNCNPYFEHWVVNTGKVVVRYSVTSGTVKPVVIPQQKNMKM